MSETDAKRNRIYAIVAVIVAALILACALIYSNLLVKDDSVYAGGVGEDCPDFTFETYSGANGGQYTLSERPETVKVTVINFWATWCGPCVKELPHFMELQRKYPDTVQVLAIHSDDVDRDVQDFIDRAQWTDILFLQDKPTELKVKGEDGELQTVTSTLCSLIGGSTALPITLILDANGVIQYRRTGSITYSMLEQQVTRIMTVK